MIKSMTGFGKSRTNFKNGEVAVEIRTVNHKFFDATLKLPNSISAFEDRIKEILQKRVRRGKLNLTLTYEGPMLKEDRLMINKMAAKNYYDKLSNLRRHLGAREEIGLKELITLPGVLSYDALEKNLTKIWPNIRIALERALDKLISDREREGAGIFKDLMGRTKRIEGMLSMIKSRAHLNIEEYKRKFKERIKDLTGGRNIDRGRLEMEVAIFAKNSDISEEITRLENHLAHFKKAISSGGEVGKKIDFIAQELHREINTIGSKVSDFKISKNVIEIKSEIEKIREQAKNLE